jgi:hypothetical protein
MKVFSLVNTPLGWVEEVARSGIPTKLLLLEKDGDEIVLVGTGSYHRDVIMRFFYNRQIAYPSSPKDSDLVQAGAAAGYRILGGCDVHVDCLYPTRRPMKISGTSFSFGELSSDQLDRIRTRLGAQ